MDNNEYVTITDSAGTYHVQPHPDQRDKLMLTFVDDTERIKRVRKCPILIAPTRNNPFLIVDRFNAPSFSALIEVLKEDGMSLLVCI